MTASDQGKSCDECGQNKVRMSVFHENHETDYGD